MGIAQTEIFRTDHQNLLEHTAQSGFTEQSGEMAEWLKAMVC
jgi:hypothetical protein